MIRQLKKDNRTSRILIRLSEAVNAGTLRELGGHMGGKASNTLSGWVDRDNIPGDALMSLILLAEERGISLDWLLKDKPGSDPAAGEEQASYVVSKSDPDIASELDKVMEALERTSRALANSGSMFNKGDTLGIVTFHHWRAVIEGTIAHIKKTVTALQLRLYGEQPFGDSDV